MLKAFFSFKRAEEEDPSYKVQDDALRLRILTHNIRYATDALFENERPGKIVSLGS